MRQTSSRPSGPRREGGVVEMARGNPLLHAVLASATHGADTELLPLLTTHAESLLAAAKLVVGRAGSRRTTCRLDAAHLEAAIDMVVRVVLSHVMQPSGSPAETADDIAWISARVAAWPDDQLSALRSGRLGHRPAAQREPGGTAARRTGTRRGRELGLRGALELAEVVVVVRGRHLEGGARVFPPPLCDTSSPLGLGQVDEDQLEPGTGVLREAPDRPALVGRPTAEVQDHANRPRAASGAPSTTGAPPGRLACRRRRCRRTAGSSTRPGSAGRRGFSRARRLARVVLPTPGSPTMSTRVGRSEVATRSPTVSGGQRSWALAGTGPRQVDRLVERLEDVVGDPHAAVAGPEQLAFDA